MKAYYLNGFKSCEVLQKFYQNLSIFFCVQKCA